MRQAESKGGWGKAGALECSSLVASKLARRGLDPGQILAGKQAAREGLKRHLAEVRNQLGDQQDEARALENQLFYVQYLRK
jgi:hypothetical protein